MNQNVNPVLAFFIVFFAITILSFKFWASGQALYTGGPNQMQHDREGNLYINITDTLYKLSPDMKLLNEYPLDRYGVSDLVGDFAFFSNGDILIRKGKHAPSLVDAILINLRLYNLKNTKQSNEGEGTYRCNLETAECIQFSQQLHDLNSSHHVEINWETDDVFITDTPHHTLYKFDKNGDLQAERKKSYLFPNQISYIDNSLYIADTNHHRIQISSPEDEDFGEIKKSYRVINSYSGKNIWTFSFAKVGDEFWINNMADNMTNGKIFVFGKQWVFLGPVNLPENADPVDIRQHGDYVFISDFNNAEIYTFDATREQTYINFPKPIADKLAQIKTTKSNFEDLDSIANILLFLFLISGFVFAYIQMKMQPDPSLLTRNEKININPQNPRIKWIKKNFRHGLIAWLSMGILVVAVMLSSTRYLVGPDPQSLPIILPLGAFVFVLFFITRWRLSPQIGYMGDTIIIKKNNNNYAAAIAEHIFYSDRLILIDKTYIHFNGQNSPFDYQEVVEHIIPRLKKANYVSSGAMSNMIIKRTSKILIFMVLIAIGAAFYHFLIGFN